MAEASTDTTRDVDALASDIKTYRARVDREANDARCLAQAKIIVSARAEVKAAEAEVGATAKPLGGAEKKYHKYDAKIKKADNERAEIEQGIKTLKTPEQRDIRLVVLKAEMAKATELRDHYMQKYTEAGQVAANAADRVLKARAALAKAEAVLGDGK